MLVGDYASVEAEVDGATGRVFRSTSGFIP